MRVETAGAKTWLLGAVALWALVLWALGLFGLGGRIERLPEDPSLLQPLPRPAANADERLGPLPQYAEIGDRPLFTNDRRPQPFLINPEGEGEEEQTFEYVLTSVLLTPGLEMAIVQPAEGGESVRLRVGDAPEAAPAWRLGSISARSAVFNGPEGERTLELRVFDGSGGQPPTPMAAQPPQQPQQQPAAATRQQAAAAARGATQDDAPVRVTTSSSPAPVPVSVPEPGQAPQPAAEPAEDAVQTPDSQVEAIRQRIEARRARLRQEQAQRRPQPPAESP